MIVGLGLDLFDVARIETELHREGSAFARRVFTQAEVAACDRRRRPAREYATLFAAKEAVVKALCLDGAAAVPWTDIEICCAPAGDRRVAVLGLARRQADRLGVGRILLSTACAGGVALASVLLESTP